MALDLIKQYLVGIGFNVDANSLKTAQESMAQADQSIKKFNDDSNKGFSETSGSLKDLFNLFTSSPNLLKMIPGLGGPFKSLIRDISLAKKMSKEMTEIKSKEDTTKAPKGKNKAKNINKFKDSNYANVKDIIKVPDNPLDTEGAKKKILDFASNANKGLADVGNAAKGLLSKGGGAIKTFASTGAGSLMLIVGAAVATMAAIKKLVSSLKEYSVGNWMVFIVV